MKRAIHVIAFIAVALTVLAWLFPTRLIAPVFSWVETLRPSRHASMLFVGDMMFDRTIRQVAEREGGDSLFSCLGDYLDGFDVVVGNLEGPITASPSLSLSTVPGQAGNTTFTFPTSTAGLLGRNGVDVVSLANNHSLDFGREGLEGTRAYLRSAGVGFFGDPLEPSKKSVVMDANGLRVALVGFNEFLGVDSVSGTEAEIRALRPASDYVIVFAHWGEEYVPAVERQRVAGRAFIDAGADAVIGAHPHVIQEIEEYEGKSIYYSLGNFIFDQYWEEGVRRGMALELNLFRGTISFNPRYVNVERNKGPCLEV